MESPKGEALIRLLDDPDQLVFEAVSHKIEQMGIEMLPDLESAAMEAMSPILHERIELIIKAVQFNQLKTEINIWLKSTNPKLIDGAWLISRYQFPDLSKFQFENLIKPLREEIWLEFSDTLTALEKIRIMNTFLFGKNKVKLNDGHPESPGNNFINRVLETGKANEHSMSLLYALLGQELSLPLFVADMPDFPILTYIDMAFNPEEINYPEYFEVLFFINPADSGTVHSRRDVTNYLIKQSLPLKAEFYKPRSNVDFIKICLKKLALDYEITGSEKRSLQVRDLISLW